MRRRMMLSALVLVALAAESLLPPAARAWGDFGHMQVAALAYARLSVADRLRANALLRRNPRYARWVYGLPAGQRDYAAFLSAATWADEIKSDADYHDDIPGETAEGYDDKRRHSDWHYINEGFSPDGTPLVAPPAVNVATQLARFRAVLSDATSSDALKSYALSWLLHLVGDVHQPLHCVARFDREDPAGDQGGNLVQLQGAQPPGLCRDPRYCLRASGAADKLHTFLDAIAGTSCCPSDVEFSLWQLPAASAAAAANTQVEDWIREGVELAQQRIYSGPIGVGQGPFTVDAAYAEQMLELARARIALAGARLARVLHTAFAAERSARALPPKAATPAHPTP